MKKMYITLFCSIIISVSLSWGVSALVAGNQKVGYVKLTDLYNGFLLKKKLEATLENTTARQERSLDSLALGIKALGDKAEKTKEKNDLLVFEQAKKSYVYRKKQIMDESQAMSGKWNEQVWRQLNQYVKEFGDREGYKFILGINGSGSLMQADSSLDLTKSALAYVNERFKGEVK